jgi:ATP-dependent DNA helicase RecG
LTAPVTVLKGVGPRQAERLRRLGLYTLQDLLLHLPLRYQDRTRAIPIGVLRLGMEAVVQGTVLLTEPSAGRRPALLVRVQDGSGLLTLRFFHFHAGLQATLHPGATLRCFGEARRGPAGLEMIHPEVAALDPHQPAPLPQHLTPIYPATEGLTASALRGLIERVLRMFGVGASGESLGLAELLPEEILAQNNLWPLARAIAFLHAPPREAELVQLQQGSHPAQLRLVFEELLAHHLSLRRVRQELRRYSAPALPEIGRLVQGLVDSLPFALTQAQQQVIGEIRRDIAQTTPMLRLLQGDVGSGKTIVAAIVALQAIASGYQAALMAPTDLLAEQHFRNFHRWFEPLGAPVRWLAGRLDKHARTEVLAMLASHMPLLVIGTHALFQEDVAFSRLGLAIIDEQHRFGVHQRLALRDKGRDGNVIPHQLIMTATPIPRTLAMTAYADLDTSVIGELPPGRKPIRTAVISSQRRDEVIARIASVCEAGRQVYWVCTLIEESEALQCQAATDVAVQLAASLPGVKVGLAHGRMRPEEKEQTMAAFSAGELDLLVATTVIEVGVDVPNASLMVIENAERLGLAQLHQLRGRVGRGAQQSDCVLMYQPPLGDMAKARLAILRESQDGFEIAEKDLELRGPGELLGTRQAGVLQLRVADLTRHRDLLPAVEQAAETLLQSYPERVPLLIQRWLGNSLRYGGV